MNRYHKMFEKLAKNNEHAFIPFVTIGDPNKEKSFDVVKTLVSSGADALELGIPFSDPLADGPAIQNSTVRALRSGVNLKFCFSIIKEVRNEYPSLPIGLLMYSNLIFANGIELFYKVCHDAGVDSVLIADVPVNESSEFHDKALDNDVLPVYICPPNISDKNLKIVASKSFGYIYLLSRPGVTGVEINANMPTKHIIKRLKELKSSPPILGFGISKPAQVREAINAGSRGAISGSAIARIIEEYENDDDLMHLNLSDFVRSMKESTR
jgi:tryptophan synthase alpha chain